MASANTEGVILIGTINVSKDSGQCEYEQEILSSELGESRD
jgi:hypothetical protein